MKKGVIGKFKSKYEKLLQDNLNLILVKELDLYCLGIRYLKF